MDRQGRSFIHQNNRFREGERYCEPCLNRGNITLLGSMTRVEYVRAYFPPLPRRPEVDRRGEPCPVCHKSVITGVLATRPGG